jgi:hypothetical protein
MLREINDTLFRMTDELDHQTERLGRLQNLLDDHDSRLADLAARIEQTRLRLDALLDRPRA